MKQRSTGQGRRARRLLACLAAGLALACGVRLALAAGATNQVSAEVLSPLETATLVVNQLLDRFAPNFALRPEQGAGLRLPGAPPAAGGGGGLGGGGAGGTAPSGQVATQGSEAGTAEGGEATVNAEGGTSVSVMGGTTLAHMVTRNADGQVQVDFN